MVQTKAKQKNRILSGFDTGLQQRQLAKYLLRVNFAKKQLIKGIKMCGLRMTPD